MPAGFPIRNPGHSRFSRNPGAVGQDIILPYIPSLPGFRNRFGRFLSPCFAGGGASFVPYSSPNARDKMSAARRKGKWVGGIPVLGYDLDPRAGRLVVNEDEARRVRAIFDLYLEHRSLISVVREINRRGWTTKIWVTQDGAEHPGKPFTKSCLFRLLTNVIYTGQVNHKGTL